MNQNSIIKLASLIARERQTQKAAEKLREQLRGATGKWLCSHHGVCADGKDSIQMQIGLPVYLNLFPSPGAPSFHTWVSSAKGEMRYMKYPSQYLGIHSATHIWIYAETEAVAADPSFVPAPEQIEVAA